MGLFRSVKDLFRGKGGKDRDRAAAELPDEQATTTELPDEQATTTQLPDEQATTTQLPDEQATTTTQLPDEQATTTEPQLEAAPRAVKYEARPNPDKPGWGLAIGQELRKARGDRPARNENEPDSLWG